MSRVPSAVGGNGPVPERPPLWEDRSGQWDHGLLLDAGLRAQNLRILAQGRIVRLHSVPCEAGPVGFLWGLPHPRWDGSLLLALWVAPSCGSLPTCCWTIRGLFLA